MELIKEEPMLNKEHFPESKHRLIDAIERIRGQGGEEYEGGSELARRNPVKPDTAPLLTSLVEGRSRILELGTAYGFSTLHLAWHGADILTVEFDEAVAEQAQDTLNQAGVSAVVSAGTAKDIVHRLELDRAPATFDTIFLDHDKSQYLADFQRFEQHLEVGALILADNVNDRRAECGDFVEYVLDKYGGYTIPTEAGLLVAETTE